MRSPAVRAQVAFGREEAGIGLAQTVYFGESEGDGRWAYWALSNVLRECLETPTLWAPLWEPYEPDVEPPIEIFAVDIPAIGDEAVAVGRFEKSWGVFPSFHALVRVGTTVTLIDLNADITEAEIVEHAVPSEFIEIVQLAAGKLE
jgi:hypothetical protein